MKAKKFFRASPVFLALAIFHYSFLPQIVMARPGNSNPYWPSPRNLTMHDLSNRFKVTMPGLPAGIKSYERALNVAVIPTDSIAAVHIPWYIIQDSMTTETEQAFETELLNCTNGKDSTLAETKKKVFTTGSGKKQAYCERIGYGDGSAGHYGEIYYCSFVKGKNLVILEMSTLWENCTFYGSASLIRHCQTEQSRARQGIDSYFKNIIAQIKITRL
jgi:hypothetical protein